MWGQFGNSRRWLSVVLLGALSAGSAWADEPPLRVLVTPRFTKEQSPAARNALALDVDVEVQEVQLGEHWIGVHLGEIPEIAKAQLNLDYGLAVIDVLPGAPARKAGVEPLDILLRVGDTKLREPIELVRAVNEAGERSLKLTLLRQGKERTLEVQPEKRPKAEISEAPVARVLTGTDVHGGPEWAQLERALRALHGAAARDEEVGLWFVRPPFWASPEVRVALQTVELPDDVQVTMRKKGREPAHVTVQRGDQTWETTQDKLESLPDELREPVGRLLGKRSVTVQTKMIRRHDGNAEGGPDAGVDREINAKLELILKKLDRLGGPPTADRPQK